MTDSRVPVVTPRGRLYGRDCIFLDLKTEDSTRKILTLEGEFNGNLCEISAPGQWIQYKIQFYDVAALRVEDLDLTKWDWDSSFDEIFDSAWAAELQLQSKSRLRYFTFQTYDDLFNIVCGGYRLLVSESGV